jgi:transcriptional regulator with XRE-family HTH domain
MEIADKLGVARSTVQRYLKQEWELLLEEKRELSGAYLDLSLERLEELYADLPRDPETGRVTLAASEQARKLIATQAKILGLGSRVEISGPGGGPVEVRSDEAIRAELVQALDRIEAAPPPPADPDDPQDDP